MPSYTTDTLLATIKRKAMIPAVQTTFPDTDLLTIATEEMHNTLLPALMDTREEFFVVKQAVATLNGTKGMYYEIPHRAVGMALRDVSITQGDVEWFLTRHILDDIEGYPESYYNSRGGFYIKNNNVYLLNNESGTLNFYYFLRPGDLVKSTSATTIVSTDANNKQITVSTVPTGWTVGTIIDVINHRPGFDTRMISNTITNITSTTITFQDDLPSKPDNSLLISTGNWVVEEGYSPVPQIPVEFFQYLAEAVTAYIMESQGDAEGYERCKDRMSRMLKAAQSTINPRVEGASKKFVPRRNRYHTFNNW